MSPASEISDTAAEWLIRLEAQTSPETWDTFQSWLDQNARHRAAFVRLRVAWVHVDALKNMRPTDGTIDADLLGSGQVRPANIAAFGPNLIASRTRAHTAAAAVRERRRVLAAVAAVALAGVAGWLSLHNTRWTSYTTSIGQHTRLALEDGSAIDLNTNSELRTRFSGHRRETELLRGEALFHVAHDAVRPFSVRAAGTIVRAVGTVFSVRVRDAQRLDVLVADGRVAVAARGVTASALDDPALLSSAEQLSAGEAAYVSPNKTAVKGLLQTDVTRRLAWTDGHLAFQGETLEEAVREFNRYNERQIVVSDPSIRGLQVGGIFSSTDPESFVAALRKSFGIEAHKHTSADIIELVAGSKP